MAYLAMGPEEKTTNQASTQKPTTSDTAQLPVQQQNQNQQNNTQLGTFTDFDEATFASAKGSRILFFHAPWCFQCREIEKDIKANLSQIPAGTTIYKIDYDSNQDLRKKYGVKLQTSFLKFDADGKVIKNFVAYDEPSFANLKKNIL